MCVCVCRVAVVVSSANMELELVRQCLDRALVLDERVSKFSVQLGEWPGDMAKLLDFLSREDVRSAACALPLAGRHLVAPSTHWPLWFFPCQAAGRLPPDAERQVRPLQGKGERPTFILFPLAQPLVPQ